MLLDLQVSCITPRKEGFFKIPDKATDISNQHALQYMLQESPKLRAFLPIVRDEILLHNEKSIVCGTGTSAWWLGPVADC